MHRRSFLLGSAATAAGLSAPFLLTGRAAAITSAQAAQYFSGTITDNGVAFRATNFKSVDPRWQRQMVKYFSDEPQGTVVIDTNHNHMYWIWENNTAIRYGVGVGREGFKWYGRANVAAKKRWPTWTPPKEMHERQPGLPKMMEGGANNPLGARALYLHNGSGDTGYRLHGTAEPWSIGYDVSSGCIRMFNEDIIDLYRRVPVGTSVLVLEHIADKAGQFFYSGGLTMKIVTRAAASLVLLFVGLAIAGCNTTGAFDDPNSGKTDDPAVGFANAKPDSEEYFVVNIGRRIYFTRGSAEIDDVARELLDVQANWLVRNNKWLIKLQGFADDPGSEAANIELSKRRADAVMSYLASRGVDSRRMWAKGYGKERPVRNCPELACKAQNRRVNVNLRKEFDAAAPQYAGRS